ncbi:MAG: RHS repeat-associated core domain-containing protein [Chloroflexota bacterium]
MGTIKYYPYGDCRNSQGTLGTDKLFTGQRLDDTGLYYYGARYYDPTIGRFISPDTIVQKPTNPQTLNRYSYVINNPLRYRDPSGNKILFNTGDPNFTDLLEAWQYFESLCPDVADLLMLSPDDIFITTADPSYAKNRVEGSMGEGQRIFITQQTIDLGWRNIVSVYFHETTHAWEGNEGHSWLEEWVACRRQARANIMLGISQNEEWINIVLGLGPFPSEVDLINAGIKPRYYSAAVFPRLPGEQRFASDRGPYSAWDIVSSIYPGGVIYGDDIFSLGGGFILMDDIIIDVWGDLGYNPFDY